MPASSASIRSVVLVILAAMLTLAIISLAYSGWLRHVVVPGAFSYLPKESNVILATGPIDDLWNGIEYHLGDVIRGSGAAPGFAAEIVGELERFVDEGLENLPDAADEDRVAGLDGLVRHGIDVSGGLLLGARMRGSDGETMSENASLVAILPVRTGGKEALRRFLSALLDAEGAPHECGLERVPRTLLLENDVAWLLAFPEPGVAVLGMASDAAATCRVLERAFATDNLEHARSDDILYDAARRHLERPLLAGSGALLVTRALPLPLAPRMTTATAVSLLPDRMTARLAIVFDNDRARIVDEVLAMPPAAERWRDAFTAATGAVMTLHDTAIPRYLDFAALDTDIEESLADAFGGILEDLDEVEELRQVVVAALDYEEGLPKLALGIWGRPASLASLMAKVQRRLRDTRDRAVLRGAISRYRQAAETADDGVADMTLAALREDVLCEDERSFDRWSLNAHGELESEPVDASVLDSAEYRIDGGRVPLRFLDPAVTSNDFEFRLDMDECGCGDQGRRRGDVTRSVTADRHGCAMLREGRYRLTAAIDDDTLWLTFGRDDLESILSRMAGRSAGEDAVPAFTLAHDGELGNRKGGLYVNVPQLIETGLLSGERDIQQNVERFLFDLRNHPETTASLEILRPGREIRLQLDATRADGNPVR